MRCSALRDHSLNKTLPRSQRSARAGDVRQQALGFLHALGGDPDAIAARLAREGARGVTRDTSRCVLANYLAVVLPTSPRVVGVAVDNNRLIIWRSHWLGRKQTVELPDALRCFIRAFDEHRYPELEYGADAPIY